MKSIQHIGEVDEREYWTQIGKIFPTLHGKHKLRPYPNRLVEAAQMRGHSKCHKALDLIWSP